MFVFTANSMTSPLRVVLKSRSAIVRRRIKTLLATHQHPARARLSGVGSLPAALMRAATRAAVCPGGVVGGSFLHGDRSVCGGFSMVNYKTVGGV